MSVRCDPEPGKAAEARVGGGEHEAGLKAQGVELHPIRLVFLQRDRASLHQRLGRGRLAGAEQPECRQQARAAVLPAAHANRFRGIARRSLVMAGDKRKARGRAAGLDGVGCGLRDYSRD
jgi:hypothetical protein